MTEPRVYSDRKLEDVQIREAHRLYKTGKGLREVAEAYGISHVQLASAFHRLNLPVRGNRTTDPEVVRSIAASREQDGMTWKQIAAQHGLSLRRVQDIYRTKWSK